jgi:hypothetical protein
MPSHDIPTHLVSTSQLSNNNYAASTPTKKTSESQANNFFCQVCEKKQSIGKATYIVADSLKLVN